MNTCLPIRLKQAQYNSTLTIPIWKNCKFIFRDATCINIRFFWFPNNACTNFTVQTMFSLPDLKLLSLPIFSRTYFVITASEANNSYPYHTFKTPQDTMMVLHSTPNPSLFQFQQILSYSEFQLQLSPSFTDTDGRLTTNMLVLYSITGVFTLILLAIIIVMTVVSTYTLSKMYQNHSFPCQKKRCNLSSLELNQNSLDRRVQPSSRYVELQTKLSPSSGSNTTESSCPV